MRRLKMLLMSAVLTVAMLVALASPAMADDFCCFLGDHVGDGDIVVVLDEEDFEDLVEDAIENAIDDGRFVVFLDDDFGGHGDGILFV